MLLKRLENFSIKRQEKKGKENKRQKGEKVRRKMVKRFEDLEVSV